MEINEVLNFKADGRREIRELVLFSCQVSGVDPVVFLLCLLNSLQSNVAQQRTGSDGRLGKRDVCVWKKNHSNELLLYHTLI